ncbi:MAG TPA: hypothetical protein VN929_13660 [Burkholderiales bacterium]|nr:hypothetical protein [Burkholderiales bacterium]
MARIVIPSGAWRVLCGAGAAVVLFTAAGIAFDVTWIPASSRARADAVLLPATAMSDARSLGRCPYCGWIESRREIDASGSGNQAMSYEYTVRMADGSSRVFEEQADVRWRLRERLQFIDGISPPH